jgi:AcrR family transcriptional regulator
MVSEVEEEGTAARILAAATELLVAEGYAALSMRKVAGRLGLSQAAIYRHYKDKAELVGRIVAGGYSELVGIVEGLATKTGRPETILAEGIRDYVGFATKHASIFKAVLLQDIGRAQTEVNALSAGVARRRRTFGLLADFLEAGMKKGVFAKADPEITAQALWTAMFGLASRAALEGGKGRRRLDAVLERQIEIILRGLRA